jgi:hypothetical protein
MHLCLKSCTVYKERSKGHSSEVDLDECPFEFSETQYTDLSDAEKTREREQARRYLPVIAAALTGSSL